MRQIGNVFYTDCKWVVPAGPNQEDQILYMFIENYKAFAQSFNFN